MVSEFAPGSLASEWASWTHRFQAPTFESAVTADTAKSARVVHAFQQRGEAMKAIGHLCMKLTGIGIAIFVFSFLVSQIPASSLLYGQTVTFTGTLDHPAVQLV